MDSALVVHRLHFAFTATFHYLFPQLTMGLAPHDRDSARCWRCATPNEDTPRRRACSGKLFAVNFAFGVVTGIPMEFQFGTNWARFSRFAGGVIGQTLAMEGMFAFFLESSFLGLFLFGEKRLSPRAHLASAVRRLRRVVAVGLLHRRHGRLDAAPGRLHGRPRRSRPAPELVGAAAQPLGLLAVPAHDGRRPGDRRLRHRWPRRVLRPSQQGGRRPRGSAGAPADRRGGGRAGQPVAALPLRRPSGSAGGHQSTRDAGRDGGALRDPSRRARWCWSGSRTPTSGGSTTRWRSRRC